MCKKISNKHRMLRFCLKYSQRVVIALILLALLLAVSVIGWLKSGPRQSAFVSQRLEHALNKTLAPEYTLKIGKSELYWESISTPLIVDLQDISLSGGASFLTLNRIRVTPYPHMLLFNRLRFGRVELVEPSLKFTLPEEAPVQKDSDLKSTLEGVMQSPEWRESLAKLEQWLKKPSRVARSVTITRGKLTLAKHGEEFSWSIPEAYARFMRREISGQPILVSESVFDSGGTQTSLKLALRREDDNILAEADIHQLALPVIAKLLALPNWLQRMDINANHRINLTVSAKQGLRLIEFETASNARSDLNFSIKGVLDNRNDSEVPVFAPHVQANFQAQQFAMENLSRYWPPHLAEDARNWVVPNIPEGLAKTIRSEIDIPSAYWEGAPLPKNAMLTSIEFERCRVIFADNLPHMTETSGVADFTTQTMTVTLDEGTLLSSALESAVIHIPNLGGDDVEKMDIDATFNGPLKDLVPFQQLQSRVFNQASEFDLARTEGQANTTVKLHFPLLKTLTGDAIDVTADITSKDFTIRKAWKENDLTKGDVKIRVHNQETALEGTATLATIPVQLKYLQSRAPGGASASELNINTTTPVEALRGIFNDIPSEITGTVSAEVKQNGAQTSVIIDAAEASFAFPSFGLFKPAGAAQQIRLDATDTDAKTKLNNISLAGEIRGEGSGEVADKNYQITLNNLEFGQNKLKLNAVSTPQNLRVQVEAEKFDAAPILDDNSETAYEKPMSLTANIRSLMMKNGQEFRNVKAFLRCAGNFCQAMDIQGVLPGKSKEENKNFSILTQENKDQRTLKIRAQNAGAFMRGADLFKHIRGGTLEIDGTSPLTEEKYTGTIAMRDFRVIEAPVLAKLLTLGSLTGIASVLNGQGIMFEKLRGQFVHTDDLFTLKRLKAYGSSIGITVEGTADTKAEQLQLEGTVIPAYTLNKMLGEVPIIGNIVGEGVFATNYKIVGSFDNPEVKVNPLSTLTPGIIKDFFRELSRLDEQQTAKRD